ncbi:MAG: type II toxin-antitoxin system RelE/ParE family toxin [Bacteroidales bacterium]|nr:type II toxin-antitoxin system RelE/ParE family toxin [Bacteroidales bacterium]
MEAYEIIWTSRAASDLKKVYHFYKQLIGEQKAFDLIMLLFKQVDRLSDKRFIKMGASDDEFEHLKRDYRKLIEGDIKVTYRLSISKTIVFIIRLFDTRQHPSKNK